MNQLRNAVSFLLSIILLNSCSSLTNKGWEAAIPEKAAFVIIPKGNATLQTLQSSYAPFLDDITGSTMASLARIDSAAGSSLKLKAIMLYPGANNKLEPVWASQASAQFIDRLKKKFHQDFSQNQYYFHDIVIHKLPLGDHTFYAAKLGNTLVISESSLGLEDAVRAYTGNGARANLDDKQLKPGQIVMNTPALDRMFEQLAKVVYHPAILNALEGTGSALLSVKKSGKQQNSEFQFSGNIPLNGDSTSNLVTSISTGNVPITLDRYISSNAAAFALFRHQPSTGFPTIADTSRLDSLFITNEDQYSTIANTLSQNFSLVMYAKSGFLSTGEHLFLRSVSNISVLQRKLSTLADNGYIKRRGETYFVQSAAIGQLIGGPLCSFRDFYLGITDDVVIISKRKGLVEIVSSDKRRRRTMYYEQKFRNIKKDLPQKVSGLFVTNTDFYSFLEPFLASENYVNALLSKFDLLTVSTKLGDKGNKLAFNLKTYRTKERSNPYREKWLFPTESELSGEPVLADIGGGKQKEIIFATKSGNVYALAADGTQVFQTSTGADQPIGSAVVYDWYSTNEKVILMAAGNKIYGWDDNGDLLPKFPFQLNETITSPLVISDINQNGRPNALVATANRRLHAINGRGQDIEGWPVTTNTEIHTRPTTASFMGSASVIAFSENAVHAWFSDGTTKKEFPKFITASLSGSPVMYKGSILGNAADGNLYSIGPKNLFADSLNVYKNKKADIKAIYTSNNSLTGTPIIRDLKVGQHQEYMILTMSSNGSVFLFSTAGQLRFTQNMGQPAAPSFSPFISDINRNGQDDIVALANFGRLYIWQTASGKRVYSVPTSGMKYPVISDIDSNGYNELIAQTQEGLQCWTIYGNK